MPQGLLLSAPADTSTKSQSRREFLGQAIWLAGGTLWAGCANQSIAPLTKEALPRAEVIDTHTHFYDPKRPAGVPWPPKGDPVLYRTVLPGEYEKLAVPLGITGTLVVEASQWVEDNQWILDLEATSPFLRGLVGHLEPGSKNFRADLKRFAANKLFRGIRIGVWNPEVNAEKPETIADLRAVSDLGLAVDFLIRPSQLMATANLADRLPDLKIVIDHCANVQIDGKSPPAEWVDGIHAAARRPNIAMKVSGLAEGTGRADGSASADTEFYRPVLDTLWNSFGPNRLLFGSNWPVCTRFADLATVKAIVSGYFDGCGSEARRKYFYANASRIYGVI